MSDAQMKVEVRFPDFPGIVDSARLQLTADVVVLTGRNNVGKTRVLRSVERLAHAASGPGSGPTPEVWITREVWQEAAERARARLVQDEIRAHELEDLATYVERVASNLAGFGFARSTWR